MESLKFPVINDDLIHAERYQIPIIVQQTNCCTIRGHGLSQYISDKLGVNPYIQRRPDPSSKTPQNCAHPEDRPHPGTIQLMIGTSNLYVVNMYAQYSPGKPNIGGRYPVYVNEFGIENYDSPEFRQHWFRLCCQQLHKFLISQKITQVGVPYQIGCGLAGGNWEIYSQILKDELPETIIFKL